MACYWIDVLIVTFERVVTEDYKLSDGFVIPANTTIGVPTQAISMDPKLYPNPTKFDAFRFEKLRNEKSGQEGKAQYVASNPESMAFGYGRHACPGRFFAANEIKAIMAYLLQNYDMKFKDGEGRPESLLFETQFLPNPTGVVLFKRRKNWDNRRIGVIGTFSTVPITFPYFLLSIMSQTNFDCITCEYVARNEGWYGQVEGRGAG